MREVTFGEARFEIKEIKKQSEMKSVRFPVEMLDEIEKQIAKKNMSFSSFVIQACQFALEHKND